MLFSLFSLPLFLSLSLSLSLSPSLSQSWYHGGVLLQWRHSTLVGAASMADIMAQVREGGIEGDGRERGEGGVGGGNRGGVRR